MPFADPEKEREYRRNQSRLRRERGECQNCPNKARPGKTRCQPCADKQAVYTAASRARRKA